MYEIITNELNGGNEMWFRKKPVIVEGVEWTGNNLEEIIAFTGLHPSVASLSFEEFKQLVVDEGLKIFTLEGPLHASIGDFIVRGVQGEFYPIKPEILKLTYERVEHQE